MKNLEKKSKYYNEDILRKFDNNIKRDKSKDIIRGNFLMRNKKMYNDLVFDFLNQRLRDIFSDYLEKMNKSSDEKYFLEGLNKRIEIRKMF